MSLGQLLDENDKPVRLPQEDGVWSFDEDDFLLMAMLSDPIYCAELLGETLSNSEYAGMFKVKDYQYPLFRSSGHYVGHACGRSVGKTESIKWRAVSHAFRRLKENLLVTAPELIHLLPLTEEIEDKIRATRLTREFLETRGGKTGFTHRPFGVEFRDGTKIVGRIPRREGTGVKGQHQPDLIIDEAQDYPKAGWDEIHETVMKDFPDFTYHFYGVHSGVSDSGFNKRIEEGFEIVRVTRLQVDTWNAAEKRAAKGAYGGTASPEYRRQILGEPGGSASKYFVVARLVACMDQQRDSDGNLTSEYNRTGYVHQSLAVEEFDELGLPIAELLDLPAGLTSVWGGMDLGLAESPTVISLFSAEKVKRIPRLKLVRRIHLERMRTRTIREACYAIDWMYEDALKGFGMDVTGLGFPIWQEMEDDEGAPQHLVGEHGVSAGYFFNAKVPVGVDKKYVTKDPQGRLRDQFGTAVVEEDDPNTGGKRYVTYMPMIEASTRYLREMVDTQFLLLPFDKKVTADMMAESQQRVERIAGMKSKPQALHILDSFRAMAMKYKSGDIAAELEYEERGPVLARAL